MATSLRRARRVLVGAAVLFLLVACRRSPHDARDGGARDAALDDASRATNLDDAGRTTELDASSLDASTTVSPLAQKLCAALHDAPETKRAACCKAAVAPTAAAECSRRLGAALAAGSVTLTEADADACVAAWDRTTTGCDWIGASLPTPPAACLGIVRGTQNGSDECRSSLDCGGDLRCIGLGTPTVEFPDPTGRCGAPKSNGEGCGTIPDALALLTRQTDIDKRHPECRDRCIGHRCASSVFEGGTCITSADCAEGHQCLAAPGAAGAARRKPSDKADNKRAEKKCHRRPLPREHEPCPLGACDGLLACVQGRCVVPKPAGAACVVDAECRTGGCARDGDHGRCGARCDLR